MTLKDVLEEICAEEYALPANAPRHRFKRAHRCAVDAVLYPNGLPKTENKLPLKRRAVVIAAIVVLAVVTGAASIIRYNGFWLESANYEGQIYYHMFAENVENSPKTIKKLIYDDNMPDDFTLRNTTSYGEFVLNQYLSTDRVNIFGKKGAVVNTKQCTKCFFVDPITDDFIVAPVEVKGCKGFTITSKGEVHGMNVVTWSSGDYIHTVNGTLTIEELLEIAENMIELA